MFFLGGAFGFPVNEIFIKDASELFEMMLWLQKYFFEALLSIL
jgi:hypothetical protein